MITDTSFASTLHPAQAYPVGVESMIDPADLDRACGFLSRTLQESAGRHHRASELLLAMRDWMHQSNLRPDLIQQIDAMNLRPVVGD